MRPKDFIHISVGRIFELPASLPADAVTAVLAHISHAAEHLATMYLLANVVLANVVLAM